MFVAEFARIRVAVRRLGWQLFVVWECQTTPAKRQQLRARLAAFLADAKGSWMGARR
jgi:G:T-mismatch repair DNA endonuclease (very short patch repair protein)